MLFTSYGFLGFLLLLIPLYYLIPKRGQWILLLGGSYLFYFLAGPDYLLYILTTTVTTWYAAGRIEDNARAASAWRAEAEGRAPASRTRTQNSDRILFFMMFLRIQGSSVVKAMCVDPAGAGNAFYCSTIRPAAQEKTKGACGNLCSGTALRRKRLDI